MSLSVESSVPKNFIINLPHFLEKNLQRKKKKKKLSRPFVRFLFSRVIRFYFIFFCNFFCNLFASIAFLTFRLFDPTFSENFAKFDLRNFKQRTPEFHLSSKWRGRESKKKEKIIKRERKGTSFAQEILEKKKKN